MKKIDWEKLPETREELREMFDEVRKQEQRKVGILKTQIRTWLGINQLGAQLHETRKMMFELQERKL